MADPVVTNSNADVDTQRLLLGTDVAVFHGRGLRSGQPAASAVLPGSIYFVTDEGVLERSTGSAWQAYSPLDTYRRFTLTDAQIKATPTFVDAVYGAGYRQLYAAPVGLDVVLKRVVMKIDSSHGNYTNIDAAAFLQVSTNYDGAYVPNDAGITNPTIGTTHLTGLLQYGPGPERLSMMMNYGEPVEGWGMVAIGETPVVTTDGIWFVLNNNGAGNLTGGDAANAIVVDAWFGLTPSI